MKRRYCDWGGLHDGGGAQDEWKKNRGRTIGSCERRRSAAALTEQNWQLPVCRLDRRVILCPKVTARDRGARGCAVSGSLAHGCKGSSAHRTPAEPAPVWHIATRSSMSAFEATYAIAEHR